MWLLNGHTSTQLKSIAFPLKLLNIADEGEASRHAPQQEPNTASMFSTLPEQIKRMNKNFEGISESIDDSGDLHDSESNNSKDNTRSLDGQIAELTATTQATNASNLLEDIALDLSASENTGPEVSEALSKIINSPLKEKLPEDKVQSKIDSYLRPNNVASLRTPLVNHLIWHQTSAASGTQDSKKQKLKTI